MEKMHTLEIKKKVRGFGPLQLVSSEVILEVDYQMSGYIHEIRVHSEYFGAFVPVSEAWLENNFQTSLQTIRDAVSVAISEACFPKQKEYVNDDIA